MLRILISLLVTIFFQFCSSFTSFPTEVVGKGKPTPFKKELAKSKIVFKKIKFADWEVDRKGLINLDDEKSIKAGLKSGDEPIQIYAYILKHPEHGNFLIDSGIASAFRKDTSEWPVSSLVKLFMNMEKLKIHLTTKEFIDSEKLSLNGIFLTHLHVDHIMGVSDIPLTVPVYTGPGEPKTKTFDNIFAQGTIDNLLGEKRTLYQLNFPSIDRNLDIKIIDFFEDGSLYIIHSPGHTTGSLAFIVNSTNGPKLILGDTCHTKFGWENNVPPGTFTMDQEQNRKSLSTLKKIAESIPKIEVFPGHQNLE